MKRRNINKTIMQRGGLMIEALAMLGLIAVVTPTMYKKSAERTMEVEDINTAATIRTVMNAANDYVSSNYSWLISQMNANGQTVRDITAADIRPFLPYGFNLSQPLHNYNAPILKVKRPSTDSNNLTAFALFPATAAPEDGIGQERTSRIAALVGSNGGYKPTANTARGVGGIWSLNEGDFRDVFGNQGNQYSIVTASTDIINSATNNEVDMTKYLQRGSDNAAGTEWKNTMRTDLYMGGPNQDGDIYENLNGPYSIRNIKSLIVGANNGEEAGNYGLYIAPDAANPNAYVHGSLKAGEGQFKADNANLQFGGTEGAWNFVVSNVGKVMNRGDLELASDNGVWNDIKIGALRNNGSNKYLIQGSKSAATPPDGSGGGISAPYDYGSLTFMDDLMKLTDAENVKDKKVKIMENGWAKDEDGNAYEDTKYVTSIASTDPSHPIDVPVPEFPVKIDANTKVRGLLAAGQIDTNKIRTASLSVGSEHINDKYQWMTVDEKGVLIADPDRTSDTATKNRINVNKDQIVLSVDKDAKNVNNPRGLSGDVRDHGQETSSHDVQIVMNAKTYKGEEGGGFEEKDASIEIKAPNTSIHGNSTTVSGQGTLIQAGSSTDYGVVGNNLDKNQLLLRNDNMKISMTVGETVTKDEDGTEHRTQNETAETVIGPRNEANKYKVRTVFDKGNVALLDSNLNILNSKKVPVFSVGSNTSRDSTYGDYSTQGSPETGRLALLGRGSRYDIAMHGSVLFTDSGNYDSKEISNVSKYNHIYMSVGAPNKMAAVNIVGGITDISSEGIIENKAEKTLVIDTSNSKNGNNYYNKWSTTEPGTIYIRKGYVEAVGASDAVIKRDKNNNTILPPRNIGAKDAPGVVVASRFVANNTTSSTDKGYGATVPDLLTENAKISYGLSGSNRYDTYMVNPAYTSVMHDIKLTTRGGARLSDILPDFINKGIYVVTNTFNEVKGDDLTYNSWPQAISSTDGIKFYNKEKYTPIKEITIGKTWASPFLGVVPAPQCPPGYARVITLNPASFEVGLAGQLKQASGETRYYVAPIASMKASDVANSVNKETEFVQATVQGVDHASMKIEGTSAGATVNGDVNVSGLKNINTNEYVLSANGSKLKPLVIQQSTHLKSQIEKLPITKTGKFIRGWATIMGFLYYNQYYTAFGAPDDKSYSWNIFPVMPGSLEGYATVYCYFNRTNMDISKDGKLDFKDGYNTFVDSYDYMVNPASRNLPKNYKKVSGSSTYKDRLNDPELKYNEVW